MKKLTTIEEMEAFKYEVKDRVRIYPPEAVGRLVNTIEAMLSFIQDMADRGYPSARKLLRQLGEITCPK